MNDKKNAVKKLQSSSKSIRYTKLDLSEVNIGSPREYLKLYHYLFMDFSPVLAAEIVNKHQLELSMKNDKAFMDGVYKLTRDMFEYVPKLSRDQFFTTNYAQVKALMAVDIIQLILTKVKSLQPSAFSAASAASAVVSSFNHVNSLASGAGGITQLPTVMPNTSQSTGASVILAGKAADETTCHAASHVPKLVNQGAKSTRSQGHLSSGSGQVSLGRSASVNYGMSHGYSLHHKEAHSTTGHFSRLPSRAANPPKDETASPRDDTANDLLAKHVSEIGTNLNLLLNRMEKFEKFVQSQQNPADETATDFKNATVIQSDVVGIDELKSMILADRREQENMNKRVTLLENENLVLKHQNKLLSTQLGQQQVLIQQLMQYQTPNQRNSGGRASRRLTGGVLNQDYSDEENREDGDQTAFETPFHSFVVSNEDDEMIASRRSNVRKISSSTTSSQSSTADYVQIPTIGSTTTPSGHRSGALLSQGVLCDAGSLSEGLDDLSLSSNQITDPNDLTPTIDISTTGQAKPVSTRHQFVDAESPFANDALARAKQLVDRASQLSEQIQPRK